MEERKELTVLEKAKREEVRVRGRGDSKNKDRIRSVEV